MRIMENDGGVVLRSPNFNSNSKASSSWFNTRLDTMLCLHSLELTTIKQDDHKPPQTMNQSPIHQPY